MYNDEDIRIIDEIYKEGYLFAQYGIYIKKKFKQRIFKIPVDIGLGCPHKKNNGCIFCPEMGRPISVKYCNAKIPLKEQIEKQMENQRKKGFKKFCIYFYPGTNTYAPVEKLKEIWDFCLSYEDVIGLSIGTRPDCLEKEKLDILAEYVENDYDIWIDLGIQSMHQKTLEILNRGHNVSDIIKAIKECHKRKIKVCGHIILALPGETWIKMMETAKIISLLEIEAVKIYPLVVVKGTKLEELYWKGEYRTLDEKQYITLVCDFLEHLSPYVLIQRLSKDKVPKNIKISPEWDLSRFKIMNKVNELLKERGTKQGAKYLL
ncbi:TIGR01212 family radical SAM protein [Methanocaldococcus sp. 10A]